MKPSWSVINSRDSSVSSVQTEHTRCNYWFVIEYVVNYVSANVECKAVGSDMIKSIRDFSCWVLTAKRDWELARVCVCLAVGVFVCVCALESFSWQSCLFKKLLSCEQRYRTCYFLYTWVSACMCVNVRKTLSSLFFSIELPTTITRMCSDL